jgi:hypothetical protein
MQQYLSRKGVKHHQIQPDGVTQARLMVETPDPHNERRNWSVYSSVEFGAAFNPRMVGVAPPPMFAHCVPINNVRQAQLRNDQLTVLFGLSDSDHLENLSRLSVTSLPLQVKAADIDLFGLTCLQKGLLGLSTPTNILPPALPAPLTP